MMRYIRFDPLPAIHPYDHERVIRVRSIHSGMRMIDFLSVYHPPTPTQRWKDWLSAGDITLNGKRSSEETIVRAGDRFIQFMHAVVEPAVNATIQMVHEDDAILVINKPAPLPVHPSGRFHLHTLVKLLESAFPNEKLRIAHRLDANTTGLVVLCRTSQAASRLQPQFASRDVEKRYLARVIGCVDWGDLVCNLAIGDAAELAHAQDTRGARVVHALGQPARTRFNVLKHFGDDTTLVEAIPVTGRTNQIRVHLWALGHSIVGDMLYRPSQQLGTQQTLQIDQPPMCLHAHRLSFLHPSRLELVTYEAEPPEWARDTAEHKLKAFN